MPRDKPWVFWQQQWGCISSRHPHRPRHTGLLLACASWWYRCAPSPTCRGWARPRRQWACCILGLGSVALSPNRLLQWNDDGPALLMCWTCSQRLRRPVRMKDIPQSPNLIGYYKQTFCVLCIQKSLAVVMLLCYNHVLYAAWKGYM